MATETAEQAPISRRRPHRKSKTGCAECRRRRIKCGEEQPACKPCIRHKIPCVYPSAPTVTVCHTPSSTVQSNEESNTQAAEDVGSPFASHPSVPCLTESNHPSACFTIDDLALLHHWTLSTSLGIVNSPGMDRCWQEVFPQIAFRHPFVMHAILSLAALHSAYMHSTNRQRLILIATQHHNLALQGFRGGIDEICDDNSDALFACASLNFIYVFAAYGPLCNDGDSHASSVDRKSRILGAEWIPMIRGVEAVLHSVYDRVCLGPLHPLLMLGNWDELDPNYQPVAEDEHFRSIEVIWAHSSDAEIYDKTLYLLRKCNVYMKQFKTMDAAVLAQFGYNRAWSAPFIWLHSAPEEYFILLQQRQPPALLIFAYLGTLLHSLHERWFMEGWGRNIVDVVDDLLGEYWRPWMEWPKESVRI